RRRSWRRSSRRIRATGDAGTSRSVYSTPAISLRTSTTAPPFATLRRARRASSATSFPRAARPGLSAGMGSSAPLPQTQPCRKKIRAPPVESS
ncbi:unnamed protein product, partial [Ectocarpus sp. 12 AP-2014]